MSKGFEMYGGGVHKVLKLTPKILKQLTALEIIKEILNKVFDISFDDENREIFFDNSGIVFSFTKKKEEYDLLKETLL